MNDQDAAAVERLLRHNPAIMVIGRRRRGGYLAFAPQPRRYDNTTAEHRLWTVEHTATNAACTAITRREWVAPGTRMSRVDIVYTTPEWDQWKLHQSAGTDLTDIEISDATNELRRIVPHLARQGWPTEDAATDAPRDVAVLGVTHDRNHWLFEVWMTIAGSGPATIGRVRVRWSKIAWGTYSLAPLTDSPFEELSEFWGPGVHEPWGPGFDGVRRNPRPVYVDERLQASLINAEQSL